MRIEFTTREYEARHGKKPRGRGCWWFEIQGDEFHAFGTLTEAKKTCREHIKKMAPKQCTDTVYVSVMP